MAGTKPNPCSISNGDCSHFCLLMNVQPWSQCLCPLGIRLLSDGKTCDPRGIDKVLLVSAVSGLYQISLDTYDFASKQLLFEGVNHEGFTRKFYDIDFDPIEKTIFWIDASTGCIRKCNLDGSHAKDVMFVPNSVKVFRLDYVSRNIYWIDAALNRISVTSTGTAYTKFIVSRGANKIQTLALDLIDRHIYFSTTFFMEFLTR
ncbi:hypothetical protein Y032_0858g2723 [Ancylostoma ceylanicum]|uniref:Low-density lipoprotein receptor repeat class B n=1 Tax=Ancylostoma ceylanicum TaxID=53326 RepID=A0A016WA98_9BILA|nr:hypothetical protein Y032_0858g2723 [Ancylostoma ceylanicum]